MTGRRARVRESAGPCGGAAGVPVEDDGVLDARGRDGSNSNSNSRGGAAAVFLAVCLAAACRVDGAGPACAVEPQHERHACLHAYEGPFAPLDGRAHPPARLTETHTLYTIALPDDAPEQPSAPGRVGFEVPRPGCWAFFTSGDLALEATTVAGTPIAWTRRSPVRACGELGMAFSAPFGAGESLVVTMRRPDGAGLVPHAGLLVERLGDAPGTAASASQDGADASPSGVDDSGGPSDTPDGGAGEPGPPSACRASGPCTRDDECCDFCHDLDHCH